MNEITQVLLGFIAIIGAIFTTGALWFASISAWYSFKYRRDANLSLRKDYHFKIASVFENFLNSIDDPETMAKEKYDLELIAHLYSHVAKRKNKISKFSTKGSFNKDFLILQFKNWDKIDGDFNLTKKITFNQFIDKTSFLKEKITDRNELIKILGLLLISLYSDSIKMIKSISPYEDLIKKMTSISQMSTKKLKNLNKKLFSTLKFTKESKEALKELNEELDKMNENTNELFNLEKNNDFDEEYSNIIKEFEEFENYTKFN